MPKQNKNNDDELTIKEASSKLDISESTVKKYLKDFDLQIEKGSGSKAVISEPTFQVLAEISKLRANGLSIQEIKELKSQQPTKNILDQVEEIPQIVKESSSPESTESSLADQLSSDISQDDSDDLPVENNGAQAVLNPEEEEAKDTSDGVTEEPSEGEPRRRRGFNYRYVERQISNDSKRVSSFKRRLQNPNISIQERLFYEEALERRILFLNGWKHILRWVSKQ